MPIGEEAFHTSHGVRYDTSPPGGLSLSGSGAITATADESTPLHFTGKEHDTETGNDYFGARYYGSTMGRFLSPDFSYTPDAMPHLDLSNPQSFNRYVSLNDNPLGGIDADGHCGAGDPPGLTNEGGTMLNEVPKSC